MASKAIPIDAVVVGPRLRGVGDQQVETLMETIRELGLLHPITVCEDRDGYALVAGVHRLEACRRLGHAEIEANVVALSDPQRRLAECDENLAGTSLSPSERARFTAARKAAYLALHPETARHVAGAHGANASMGRASARQDATANLAVAGTGSDDNGLPEKNRDDAFAADTARKTKRSRRSVERDATRAAAILPEALEAVAGTELDTGKNLDKLAKLEAGVQAKIAGHLRAGNVIAARVTLNTADPPRPEGDNVVVLPKAMTKETKAEIARLQKAWDGAAEETQVRFLRRLEKRGVKVPPGAYPAGAARSGS